MAYSYLLAPIPKWIIINNQGTTAGGAKMYTYSSLDRTQLKPVYQDASNAAPWTNPIIFDANGTKGPFYWAVNGSNANDNYYIVVYDADGNQLWEQDNFNAPGTGGGGGGTTYFPLNNLIANGVFIDHIDNTASPINQTNVLIAPSNHKGFTPALINPIVTPTAGIVGPDIWFTKNIPDAQDQITFVDFSLSDAAFGSDPTPTQFVKYVCNNSLVGETYKCFQFPICQKVKNLAGQQVTFTIWASCGSGTAQIELFTRQYFGSGPGASAEVRLPVSGTSTMNLTTSWDTYRLSFLIPSVSGKTLGSNPTDDDALYLQLQMPLNIACDIRFTKPCLFLGNINPSESFDTYDEIDGIDQTPRVGQVITSLQSSPPLGWLPMNDGSIGSDTSPATLRKNKDTFQLYKTIWDGVSNTYAPVSGAGTRGTSAVEDFTNNRSISLTKALGRVLAGINYDFISSLTFTADHLTQLLTTTASIDSLVVGTPVLVSNSGGALPSPLQANTVYYATDINTVAKTFRLAESVDKAQSTSPIILNDDGTGTQTLLPTLGATYGEGVHQLTIEEMPAHNHPGSYVNFDESDVIGSGGIPVASYSGTAHANTSITVAPQGGSGYHNTMQPTTFMNIFIKY